MESRWYNTKNLEKGENITNSCRLKLYRVRCLHKLYDLSIEC